MRNWISRKIIRVSKWLKNRSFGSSESVHDRRILKHTIFGEGERFWSDRITFYRVVDVPKETPSELDHETVDYLIRKLDCPAREGQSK